jgi:hypothetical protein
MAGIDRSLAFSALLEHDPAFASMSMNEGSKRIDEFLGDWEAAGKPQMLDYGEKWAAERKTPAKTGDAERQTFGAHGPNGEAEKCVCLPAEPDERQVMDWAEHNAEVDGQELADWEPGQ